MEVNLVRAPHIVAMQTRVYSCDSSIPYKGHQDANFYNHTCQRHADSSHRGLQTSRERACEYLCVLFDGNSGGDGLRHRRWAGACVDGEPIRRSQTRNTKAWRLRASRIATSALL